MVLSSPLYLALHLPPYRGRPEEKPHFINEDSKPKKVKDLAQSQVKQGSQHWRSAYLGMPAWGNLHFFLLSIKQ